MAHTADSLDQVVNRLSDICIQLLLCHSQHKAALHEPNFIFLAGLFYMVVLFILWLTHTAGSLDRVMNRYYSVAL